MRTNINIKLTGKEYIDYITRKERKNNFINRHGMTILCFGLAVMFLFITILMLVEDQDRAYREAHPIITNYVYWHGFAFPDYALMGFLFLVCVAWIIHGVGFVIIKR